MEQSRQRMEESLAAMANGDTHSDTSVSDQADNSDDIPTIVVDPVDDGREVSQDINIFFFPQQLEFQTCV